MIYGQLDAASRHQNLEFTELNKIYTESGIVIDNLLKSNGSGFGIGFFYRWGHFQLPSFQENIALKISLTLALS
jgi:hypothetical protein